MNATDTALKSILKRTQVIAIVGISANQVRPSFYVARYLKLKGYRIVPINPGQAGKEILGEMTYASLRDIPADIPVDMVDIFRRSEHVPPIVDEAIDALPALRTIWMQLGIEHEAAAKTARAKGIEVVMNRCPKIEYQRMFGELRMAGFATGVISSKL
ncbi:MAG: CoA-binding protein [Paracoccaceae bacterium]